MTHPRHRSNFKDSLRLALTDSGVNISELARRLSSPGASVQQIQNKRRLVQKYLSGSVIPGDIVRDEIASALSVERGRFTEEAGREAQREQLADVLDDLADALLRVVEEKIAGARETERVA